METNRLITPWRFRGIRKGVLGGLVKKRVYEGTAQLFVFRSYANTTGESGAGVFGTCMETQNTFQPIGEQGRSRRHRRQRLSVYL